MSWLRHLCFWKPRLTLSENLAQRLLAWQSLPEPDLNQSFKHTRFVVLDVETSGFSLRKDSLIAIGACVLNDSKIPCNCFFDKVLKQELSSSKENILVHRISKSVQINGVAPPEALMSFLEYVGKDPIIAFYVGFDKPMLNKALKKHLGIELNRHTWLDAAFIAPIFFPEQARQHRNLDFWMALFGIQNLARHHAIADAIATAQLMQVIMKKADSHLSVKELKQKEARAVKIYSQTHVIT